MTTLPANQTSASGSYTTGVTLTSAGNSPFAFSGQIAAGQPGSIGLFLYSNDIQTNAAIGWSFADTGAIAGLVTGFQEGTAVSAAGLNLSNRGTIMSTGSAAAASTYHGVLSFNGGTVTNGSTGVIYSSGTGVDLRGAPGAVVNDGRIIGGSYGVKIAGAAGTVTNAGTIEGGTAAVSLAPGFANRVVYEVGATFDGTVDGGGPASTLELASADTEGSLAGFGTAFENFGTIAIDDNADWSVTGPVAAGTDLAFVQGGVGDLILDSASEMAGTVSGFGLGDIITLSGIVASTTELTLSPGGTLTIDQSGGPSMTLNIAPPATGIGSPVIVNDTSGESLEYFYNPGGAAGETITQYPSLNATGSAIDEIVNQTDGTDDKFTAAVTGTSTSINFGYVFGESSLYTFNPTSTVTQTIAAFPAPFASGRVLSDIVDDVSGASLLYSYAPSSTVNQTVQTWTGTDPSNGAPAGSEVSDVVDYANGTAATYEYNPSSTVLLNVTDFASTDPSNGAPTGAKVSDILDEDDGSSILYAYNPTSTVTQTASFYSSTDPSNGAPTGTLTQEVLDYVSGGSYPGVESSVTVYNANGTTTTTYYSGVDGTGTVITPPASGTSPTASPVRFLSAASPAASGSGLPALIQAASAGAAQDLVRAGGGNAGATASAAAPSVFDPDAAYAAPGAMPDGLATRAVHIAAALQP